MLPESVWKCRLSGKEPRSGRGFWRMEEVSHIVFMYFILPSICKETGEMLPSDFDACPGAEFAAFGGFVCFPEELGEYLLSIK